MADDWFRKTTWNKADNEDFFLRLAKVKNKGVDYNRPQYLRIQAYTLYEQKKPELYNDAIMLLNKYFSDFPEDRIQRAGSLHLLGRIYLEQKEFAMAFEFLKKATEFEIEFPNIISRAFLDYSEFVVKNSRKELFSEIEKLLNFYYKKLNFPLEIYIVNAMLAIIYREKKEMEKAKQYKQIAENAVAAEHSKFRNHRKLGLVKERDEILDELMRNI